MGQPLTGLEALSSHLHVALSTHQQGQRQELGILGSEPRLDQDDARGDDFGGNDVSARFDDFSSSFVFRFLVFIVTLSARFMRRNAEPSGGILSGGCRTPGREQEFFGGKPVKATGGHTRAGGSVRAEERKVICDENK